MNHGLQSMKQFTSTKMYIDQYYDQPNWLSVVPRKKETLDNMKRSSSFDTTVATATGLYLMC